MFERFTGVARQVVVLAQDQARERRAGSVRTEHLLLALYRVPDHPATVVLAGLGVPQADIESDVDGLHGGPAPSDAEALASLGIDLDEVRRQVEDAFGPGALDRTRSAQRGTRGRGHIPVDTAAKKALELSLREALRLGHNYIGTEHILLGLIHTETGAAHHILAARGVRLDATRVLVEQLLRGRRAG